MIEAKLIYNLYIMKNLLNLGKPLTKEAQKSILGGTYPATVCKQPVMMVVL